MYKHWTQEEDQFIEACNSQGWTAKEIAAELERSEGSVIARRNRLGIAGRNGCPKKYTRQELINIMRSAPEISYEYFNSKESGLPAATTYRQYFGSWTAALEAAGVQTTGHNRSEQDKDPPDNEEPSRSLKYSQKPDKPTKVYLVEFDGFYKIGITQQTINQRLGGRYPPYKVVLTLEFEDLRSAKQVEQNWLKAVADYKFVPDNFPEEGRGFTECFKL